jgi:hypothetical protein
MIKQRIFYFLNLLTIITLLFTGVSANAEGENPTTNVNIPPVISVQERNEIQWGKVASTPATPGNSNGVCDTNGGSSQGVKFGIALYLLETYCLISDSRQSAEDSCHSHPLNPDPNDKGRVVANKSGDYYLITNPQCGRIKGLLEKEDAALEAYTGKNNWKLIARAYTFGFLAWLI